jgi:hypothetical protein
LSQIVRNCHWHHTSSSCKVHYTFSLYILHHTFPSTLSFTYRHLHIGLVAITRIVYHQSTVVLICALAFLVLLAMLALDVLAVSQFALDPLCSCLPVSDCDRVTVCSRPWNRFADVTWFLRMIPTRIPSLLTKETCTWHWVISTGLVAYLLGMNQGVSKYLVSTLPVTRELRLRYRLYSVPSTPRLEL